MNNTSIHPKVSIITLTYNHEKYISQCIDSALNQTYQNWEMIILNDGSTDQTANIAHQKMQSDSRIKLINQENKGIFNLADNYNKALSFANGEYIAILEGDDLWYPQKLELQINAFKNNPKTILSWGQGNIIDGNGRLRETGIPKLNSPLSPILQQFCPVNINLFFMTIVSALSICIKKTALLEIGGFSKVDRMPTIDLPTLLNLSLKGEFFFIPQILGAWRNYANQTTKTFPIELTEQYYELVRNFINKNSEDVIIQKIQQNSKIEQYHKRQIVISYSRSGRYKLIRGEFKDARTDYWNSIKNEPFIAFSWKIRSIIGIIFSLLHLNIENFAKILGRKYYTRN
jgi:glycosyltransferase involved in cell wall biosynthesis